jgi:hypothetical protein
LKFGAKKKGGDRRWQQEDLEFEYSLTKLSGDPI